MRSPQSPLALCLAGAHSLLHFNGVVSGDPMEKAMLAGLGWQYDRDNVTRPVRGKVNSAFLHLEVH